MDNNILLLGIIIIFLLGLYWFVYFEREPFTVPSNCPNLLIKRGNVLLLYNTNLPVVDGTNPIPFSSLDEYIQYLKEKNVEEDCPVLFLQSENNAQGQDVYKVRPSPFDLQGGLQTSMNNITPTPTTMNNTTPTGNVVVPATTASATSAPIDPASPFNKNMYVGFDPNGQHVGRKTELDQIHVAKKGDAVSDNPMDANWGGVSYTQNLVDSGKYADNEVSKPLLFNPKTQFNPRLSIGSPPVDVLQ
jgi:hypothetical protein